MEIMGGQHSEDLVAAEQRQYPNSFFFFFNQSSERKWVGTFFEILKFCPGSDLSAYSFRFPTAKGSLTCATCTRDLRNLSSLSEKTRCSVLPTKEPGSVISFEVNTEPLYHQTRLAFHSGHGFIRKNPHRSRRESNP